MHQMKLRDIGEFGLIERLDRLVKQAGVGTTPEGTDFPLLIGIGDDTAAWRITGEVVELATTDTMVEGVHFTQETTPWPDVGWKVLVASLSDIAAMGGVPTYALVTLGLDEDFLVSAVEAMYQGMMQACQEYGAAIAGGDIVKSPVPFVSITLNGVLRGSPMRRSAARPEDLLAVTGPLGSSRGGLELMTRRSKVSPEAVEYLCQAHRRPRPKLQEGRALVEEGVLAAIDLSDGLVDDIGKMMAASGRAAQLDAWRIPISHQLKQAFPDRAIQLALAGGEDYELVYAAPEDVMERTLARIHNATVIGRVVSGPIGKVMVQDRKGDRFRDLEQGWDHFRR